MKNLVISGTGFPGTNKTLRTIRDGMAENMAGIGHASGDKAIIYGVVVDGTAVSAGLISWNGQLIEFEAGTLGTDVAIIETIENGNYNNDAGNPADVSSQPAYVSRKAVFGTGGIASFPFADLIRIKTLRELASLPPTVLEYMTQGTILIGDIGTAGIVLPVTFNAPVAHTNYFAVFHWHSEQVVGEEYGTGSGVACETRDETVNGFELRARRLTNVQTNPNSNYTLHYLIIAKQ
ncbi:MAG: hypothetical protein ITG00_00125 [Flavobacterium sp.]|nr:hypothetical protein [Flavobacterium sp.]